MAQRKDLVPRAIHVHQLNTFIDDARECRKGLSIVIIQFRCLWRGIVYLGSMRTVSGFPLNCIRLSFNPLDIKYLKCWVVKSLLLDDEVFWDSLLIRGSFSHKIKKRVQREKFQFFETSSNY